MLTLFTWGYWGWENATPELVRAVDTTERAKGFKPPIFYDIRANRGGRAVGFQNDAFQQLLPEGRYKWFPSLGNARIQSGEGGIEIVDPSAAKTLLEEAIQHAKDNRHVIFFCACEFPRTCHRHVVARLILKESRRLRRRVNLVEWPGGKATRKKIIVDDSVFKAVSRGSVTNIRLNQTMPRGRVCLPWGSILDIENRGKSLPVITGPAKFRNGWLLPVYKLCESGQDQRELYSYSEEFRRDKGLRPQETPPLGNV